MDVGKMGDENSKGESSTTAREGSNVIPEIDVLCDCGKEAIVRQAWTATNPGRRFYTCREGRRSACNYFKWRDVEPPHGWQKAALLEAREIIKAQEKELQKLKEQVTAEKKIGCGEGNNEKLEVIATLENENEAIKRDMKTCIEKEQMIRQVLVVSWIGFICAVATIVHGLK